MAGASNHTEDDKKAFVALAQKKGRPAAAKKAQVTPEMISAWAKAQGVSLRGKVPRKKRSQAPKNVKANGKANGHAVTTPATTGELALVEQQLNSALTGLRVFRSALKRAFG